jgi:C-terminal processing protease CtpA/Prc
MRAIDRKPAGVTRRGLLAAAAGLPFAVGCASQRGTIGAVLAQTGEGKIYLKEVPRGLAADRAGLHEGDEILLVDGRDVRPLDVKQLDQALTGKVGDPIKLTVVRGEQVLRVTLRLTPARRHRASEQSSPK